MEKWQLRFSSLACHFVFIIIMFVLQCFMKPGFMTNSLLATHPAVQHMVLYLMNINTVKYKWSSGTVLMAGKLLHMACLFRKFNLHVLYHFFLSHCDLFFCL